MRIALLSDVHANLAALESVLMDAEARDVAAIWNLGDAVGYGPQPDEVIERLRQAGAVSVMGNHDAAAAGLISVDDFNPYAALAVVWTAARITEETKAYLAGLPRVERDGEYTRLHGTLRNPVWEYLDTVDAALGHFELQETIYSVVGHTHHPIVVREAGGETVEGTVPGDGTTITLDERRAFINPGSVGQPRDADRRASYAVLDTDARTVSFHRVAYDIAATQQLMRERGLPERLAARLARGR